MYWSFFLLSTFQSGSVPPATNSRLSPLPPEPADFYDRNASIDIPLDSASVVGILWTFVMIFHLYLIWNNIFDVFLIEVSMNFELQDLKKKEKELQAKENELRRREQVWNNENLNYCLITLFLVMYVSCFVYFPYKTVRFVCLTR